MHLHIYIHIVLIAEGGGGTRVRYGSPVGAPGGGMELSMVTPRLYLLGQHQGVPYVRPWVLGEGGAGMECRVHGVCDLGGEEVCM